MKMGKVHIWTGRFKKRRIFTAYFKEQYKDENMPISKFAEDQGCVFYDTDWIEKEFEDKMNPEEFIAGFSYSENYIADVFAKIEELKIVDMNIFIIIDSNEISTPRDVVMEEYNLWYLGKFNANKVNNEY